MSCVSRVKKSGKDESSSYAICSKSTGWKKSKNKSWKNRKTGETFKESFDSFVEEIMKKYS